VFTKKEYREARTSEYVRHADEGPRGPFSGKD